jgi:hypothetical protein
MDNITVGTRVLVAFHAGDRAYATVTAIDHDPDRDFYRLSVAGTDEYFCTSEQVVRVLTEEEFRDRYGWGDPDRGHLPRHLAAGRPAPHAALTGYLTALAARHGYTVDTGVLDPTVGFHPREVILWAAAGASHATTGYLRHLLAAPIAFLAGQDPGSRLLDRLRDHDAHLARVRAAAARRYAAYCHTLLPTGLTWPAPATRRRPPTPPTS